MQKVRNLREGLNEHNKNSKVHIDTLYEGYITSREEYKKAKELGNITNTKVKRVEDVEEKLEQEKVYDINKMLEKARMNNKYIQARSTILLVCDKNTTEE